MGGDLLIVNIGQIIGIHQGTDALAGHGMNQLNTLSNAFLLIRGGKIEGLGQMSELPETDVRIIDAKGGFVLPTWCDSHTHIVFAESREQEMVMRHAGRTYEEIAAAGTARAHRRAGGRARVSHPGAAGLHGGIASATQPRRHGHRHLCWRDRPGRVERHLPARGGHAGGAAGLCHRLHHPGGGLRRS